MRRWHLPEGQRHVTRAESQTDGRARSCLAQTDKRNVLMADVISGNDVKASRQAVGDSGSAGELAIRRNCLPDRGNPVIAAVQTKVPFLDARVTNACAGRILARGEIHAV